LTDETRGGRERFDLGKFCIRSLDAFDDVRVLGRQCLSQAEINERVALFESVTQQTTGSALRIGTLLRTVIDIAHDVLNGAIDRASVYAGVIK
jgi:hypothetical protein